VPPHGSSTRAQGLPPPLTTHGINSTARPVQTVAALLSVPRNKKRKREAGAAEAAERAGRPPFPASHYVLTPQQMRQNDYPLPEADADDEGGAPRTPEGYVRTRQKGEGEGADGGDADGGASGSGRPAAADHGPLGARLVAVDCEMCVTEAGYELTRCTLVDASGTVLFDELAVPHNPITDHNTRFSGITPEMLASCTNRRAQPQCCCCSAAAQQQQPSQLSRRPLPFAGVPLDLLITQLLKPVPIRQNPPSSKP